MSKIYDTNFNENNLKNLFDSGNNNNNNIKNFNNKLINDINRNIDFNYNDFIGDLENKTGDFKANADFDSNIPLPIPKNISDLKIGVYVKHRNIHMSSNLDNANNSLSKINENKEFLRKIIKDTFSKRHNLYINNNNKNNNSHQEGKFNII